MNKKKMLLMTYLRVLIPTPTNAIFCLHSGKRRGIHDPRQAALYNEKRMRKEVERGEARPMGGWVDGLGERQGERLGEICC